MAIFSQSRLCVHTSGQLQNRSVFTKGMAVFLGTLVLALASRISLPMIPVPVTLQTLAVPLLGVLYGWRLGTLTVMLWLGQAAIGLPVLAGGSSGIALFFGPTAGYLASFPLIAFLAGRLAERGWDGRDAFLACLSFLAANAICLVMGAAWLTTFMGLEKAFMVGIAPFIVGGVLKAALGGALLRAFHRRRVK